MLHYGVRGPEFINYVSDILALGQLKPEYISLLTEDDSMAMYSTAFTSPGVDPDNNYEPLEFLGDSTLNKIIVWYLARRYPELMNKENVKTMARLKINMVSKVTFAKFGRDLHTEPFITSTEEEWVTSRTKLIEDTLEAFIGSIEYQIDSKIRMGAGYAICYNIMKPILDAMDISLRHEDLYDSVTRLKEVFDAFHKIIGKVEYKTAQVEDGRPERTFITKVFSVTATGRSEIAEGVGKSSKAAEISAAESALAFLAGKGFVRVRGTVDIDNIPPEARVSTRPKANYFVTYIELGGKTVTGVGYTQEDSLQRAVYNLQKTN